MEPSKLIRTAIQMAYCMDYDIYLNVMEAEDNEGEKAKWQLMQDNFGKWFSRLDSSQAKRFTNFVLKR